MVAEALRKDNKEREKTEGVEEQKRERRRCFNVESQRKAECGRRKLTWCNCSKALLISVRGERLSGMREEMYWENGSL